MMAYDDSATSSFESDHEADAAKSRWTIRDAARRVVEILQDGGHVAYFAGGCVRDRLMGIEPKDYDVATDARPDRVREIFNRTIPVGEHFGVILVQLMGHRIEVATFRAEAAYSDRRRPDQVHFTNAREDAMRRDFTINGMFEDPVADQIIDYVGGRDDIGHRVIRAIGEPDERLAEDHLRALRAVRFSARFQFQIEHETQMAIQRHASELVGVSRERIGHELRFMFAEPNVLNAVHQIQQLDLDAPALLESHHIAPLQVVRQIRTPASFPVILAGWAIDRGHLSDSGVVNRWRRALVLTNDERDAFQFYLRNVHVLDQTWDLLSVAGRKRLASHPLFQGLLHLYHATAPHHAEQVEAETQALAQTHSGLAPEPLVTGDDLAGMGLCAGPAYRRILDAVYDAQLEERIRTRAEAIQLAQRHVDAVAGPDESTD